MCLSVVWIIFSKRGLYEKYAGSLRLLILSDLTLLQNYLIEIAKWKVCRKLKSNVMTISNSVRNHCLICWVCLRINDNEKSRSFIQLRNPQCRQIRGAVFLSFCTFSLISSFGYVYFVFNGLSRIQDLFKKRVWAIDWGLQSLQAF